MTIAKEAEEIIFGDREQTYGDPAKNIRLIADMWTAYTGTTITVDDVCNLMCLLKIARLKNSPNHRDSKVDLIGYALLSDRINETNER